VLISFNESILIELLTQLIATEKVLPRESLSFKTFSNQLIFFSKIPFLWVISDSIKESFECIEKVIHEILYFDKKSLLKSKSANLVPFVTMVTFLNFKAKTKSIIMSILG